MKVRYRCAVPTAKGWVAPADKGPAYGKVVQRVPGGRQVATKIKIPHWSPRTEKWSAGDSKTLFAVTDTRIDRTWVAQAHEFKKYSGDAVTVRIATRAEADGAGYGRDKQGRSQGVGWTVACKPGRSK